MNKTIAATVAFVLGTSAVSAQELPDPGKSGVVSAGTAFNPSISVILDGSYYNESGHGGESYSEALSHVAGFRNPHDHEAHGDEGLENGFNLQHAEIIFSASVDHYFDALLNLGVSEHGVEIEEAYGVTRSLPGGLQLKLGKFYSGIGYLNHQHAHQWDFADMALPYQLIFGDHGLNEKGLQLTWTPATRHYTLFGVEALQGENAGMANHEGARDYDTGAAGDKRGPRLFTAFAKYAPDLGLDHALQLGLFGGQSTLHQNLHDSRGEEGETTFIGTDWVYKYDAGGHLGHGNLTLQAEYLYRVRDLEVVGTEDDALHPLGELRKDTQDALYVQGVYGIAPRWQTALRYELAGMTNKRESELATTHWKSSDRISASVTWLPTEFSRLRLQAGQSRLSEGDEREDFRQVYLQYQLALGVHGAHRF